MPLINQLPKLNFEGISPDHQQWLNQLTDAVNSLAGYNGEVEFADNIHLKGKTIKGVGDSTDPSSVISSLIAQKRYSAAAIRPQLEAGTSQPLQSYRQMNNRTQREQTSSWLNDLMSSPPNANTVFPTLTNVAGTVHVSIPASNFTFADGTTIRLNGRTDILSLPAQYAITSLSVAAGVVTCNCAASGLIAGQVATIVPGTNATYAGTFQLTSSTGGGSVLQMQNPNASGVDASGFVQVNGVYYYSVQKRTKSLILSGPFSADTAQNRLQVSFDGGQIVAVVTITNSGGQIASTGGGGSPLTGPPASGSFF